MSRITPLSFDYGGSLIAPNGITRAQFDGMRDSLNACRNTILAADAPFLEMPERMLDAYQSTRASSDLGRILATARRIGGLVDKVIVLGSEGACVGARALMESCCHPFHNHLGRGQRGSRPRMFFENSKMDSDWSQALLEFLDIDTDGSIDVPQGKWAIVSIAHRDASVENFSALRRFCDKLESLVGRGNLDDYIVSVMGASGCSSRFANAPVCKECFQIPDGVDGRFSVLSAAGLLPAAILGIDVVKLLEAAAAMNTHFRTASLGRNAVMDFVAVNHLLEKVTDMSVRQLQVGSKSLASALDWYDHLPATPSRLAGNRASGAAYVIQNVVVDSWRYTPDRQSLPPVMNAAINGTKLACRETGQLKTDLHIPAADETGMGQFFQMMMLATILESQLAEQICTET